MVNHIYCKPYEYISHLIKRKQETKMCKDVEGGEVRKCFPRRVFTKTSSLNERWTPHATILNGKLLSSNSALDAPDAQFTFHERI